MTTTTQGTRTALIRARFADMDTLDLETASYLLRGLDDLLFFDWLSGVGESGSTLTLDQQRAYEAWSPVIRRISYNSPLEVLLWASGSVGIGHQAVRLFERVHQARERKARADLVVDTYDLVRGSTQTPKAGPGHGAGDHEGSQRDRHAGLLGGRGRGGSLSRRARLPAPGAPLAEMRPFGT